MPRNDLSRRDALKHLGTIGAGALFAPYVIGRANEIIVAGKPVQISVWARTEYTIEISVAPLENGQPARAPDTGALINNLARPGTVTSAREVENAARMRAGDLTVRFTDGPPTLHIEDARGTPVQTLTMDAAAPGLTFDLGKGPLLGLGEGGAQFDRRGVVDPMRNGQVSNAAYRLATHGTRAPVQWMISTLGGWAMFIHQPYGAFDFTGAVGKFTPAPPRGGPESGVVGAASPSQTNLTEHAPLDVFLIRSSDPRVIMAEYARLTGYPEMPARWTLGYMQSHRTLAGPDEIMGVAKTFRDKKLPCDTLIYLGTEFTPSGWNTRNGEFTWKESNFPRPKEMIDTLHDEHFRVVLHVVIEGRHLTGTVTDPCKDPSQPSGRTPDDQWPPEREVSCYWPYHKDLVAQIGIDGWWPDQGDGLDGISRLNRHRMYWEGMQLYKPNERPFALHRNASAGIQRYGGYIWSGDIQGQWSTLATHVPDAINSGLTGFPLWGTDIGGFYPTAEYTGELHVRWFQFAAFNPLFRSHGRHWHLRTPWGWGGNDGGPMETNWRADPKELNNPAVEPICRKYLELRYQLLPYTYSALRETHETGMPMIRALWLHHPDDAVAAARGDEYYWGPDMLVAPVVEKGATSRTLYLPKGVWHDFWTHERVDGGREITRPVDLATIPLYVRAGALIPMGPVKQYTEEPSDAPTTLTVYPGASGKAMLYDDDGHTFDYRRGAWMGVSMAWDDRARTLTLSLVDGSKLLRAGPARFDVRLAGSTRVVPIEFSGQRVTTKL